MKKLISILCLFLFCMIASGQSNVDKTTAAIVDEGKLLYKSEMASWFGTDIFLEKFKDRSGNIGGYFSYRDKDLEKCIFYSKGDAPKVIGTIGFDSTYNVKTAMVDGTERDFTEAEKEIYIVRNKALEEVKNDTLFKHYKNTDLNLVPLITKKEKKVFVLTGPKLTGVVIFGNDYLLTFDKKNNLESKKQLHKNIIVTEYGKGVKSDDSTVAGMHTHLPSTGDYITSTDICTLMLYEKFTNWNQYYIISKNYISIWNCKTDELAVITKEAWDKIGKDQKKRHPGK
jgi:hypothetical protein